jgi:catechol 2,3-dioxygenase-like lactoylglutathione lyase family enzyme
MIKGIHHTAISTPDLDRLVAFYRDVMGFEVTKEGSWANNPVNDRIIGLAGSAARSVKLRAGNAYLEFFQYSAPTPQPGDPNRPPHHHGYTHIALEVTDIDAEYERLTRAGVKFNCPPPLIEGGQVRAAYGRDPDGNIIEILEIVTEAIGLRLEQARLKGAVPA